MKEICKKDLCTACYACVNACPVGCISMKLDNDLCYRPVIDRSKCINCNKCVKTCPNNNPAVFNNEGTVYSAHCKDDDIHKTSTSGGIATVIAKSIINQGGTVYGAAITEALSVNHIRCKNTDDLKLLQGSKYVHSHINDCFKLAEQDLKNGVKVLFIGTPCQISGLNNYLKKDYDNLLTIDLICHGTPDREIFEQYTKFTLPKSKYASVKSFSFRESKDYILKYYNTDGEAVFTSKARENIYLCHFLDGYILRANCYNCRYAKKERVADLTLGDFIGISNGSEYGTNLLIVNSNKGEKALSAINDEIVYSLHSMEEALKENHQLSNPVTYSKAAQQFYSICKKTGNVKYALNGCYKKKNLFIKIRKIILSNKLLTKVFSKLI